MGGAASGPAKGSANVSLPTESDGTILTYIAKSDVCGKLAQLGNRLVQGMAKKLAGKFVATFSEILDQPDAMKN